MCAVERANNVFLWGPIDVIAYHQVQLAITVIVHPGGAGGKLIDSPQTGFFSNVSECAVSVVVEQMALADGRDENVVKAIVVVISNGYSQPIEANSQSGTRSHVCKRAIAIVVIELE